MSPTDDPQKEAGQAERKLWATISVNRPVVEQFYALPCLETTPDGVVTRFAWATNLPVSATKSKPALRKEVASVGRWRRKGSTVRRPVG